MRAFQSPIYENLLTLQVDELPLESIDPQLLCISHPEDSALVEALHASTFDTQLDLWMSPPLIPAPVAAAYREDHYAAVTSTYRPSSPPLTFKSTSSARSSERLRSHPKPLPRSHQKRWAKALESFTQQSLYHSLPANDREYFHQVITKLNNAPYLASPQSLEPTVGSTAGRMLIEPHRLTGPGATAARQSVYAVLVDRPSEGAYVCWICGETRADWRLVRALGHVRGHLEHRLIIVGRSI